MMMNNTNGLNWGKQANLSKVSCQFVLQSEGWDCGLAWALSVDILSLRGFQAVLNSSCSPGRPHTCGPPASTSLAAGIAGLASQAQSSKVLVLGEYNHGS